MARASLQVPLLLIAVLSLSACATQIQRQLKNETGEVWKCHYDYYFDEFYAVLNEVSGTGYILFRTTAYSPSNFAKQGSTEKILADSVSKGLYQNSQRIWYFPSGKLSIQHDGISTGYSGKLKTSEGSFSAYMACAMLKRDAQ